jgi:very-short-patch-repair endonuclease
MASGHGAALSHRSAAELWGMLAPRGGDVHVSVPVAGGRERREGIRIHRVPSLDRSLTTSRDNIPVTRPQRTLEDLRRTVDPRDLRAAVRQAEILDLPIDAAAIVPDRAASALELAFLELCRRHRIRKPEVNVRVGPYRVDFLWRRERLVVETDGERYHRGVVATADDRERDRRLAELGFEVLRFGYREVIDEPERVAVRVKRRLAERRR